MEYFLVRLAYTPAAWTDIINNTTSMDDRMVPVRKVIRDLGGSLPSFGFFDTEHSRGAAPSHTVREKFMMWGGHDILTIVAMPSKEAAQAFNMIGSAEPGLKVMDLTPIMPLEDALQSMGMAKAALDRTGYAAPGRSKP